MVALVASVEVAGTGWVLNLPRLLWLLECENRQKVRELLKPPRPRRLEVGVAPETVNIAVEKQFSSRVTSIIISVPSCVSVLKCEELVRVREDT
jgi:hypothetical protein